MQTENYPFLIVVDIQPSFHDGCQGILYDVIDKINQTDQRVIVFYVGQEVGSDDKNDVIAYYLKNGIDEEKISQMRFIEKDYGFFRGWMDNDVSDDTIIKTVKHMKTNEMHDTRDFSHEDWEHLFGNACYIPNENPLFYPSFKHKIIQDNDFFEIVGGGRDECLKEIELFLKSLDKNILVNEHLCYGRDGYCIEENKKAIKKHIR